jgi:hypothetical protein
MITIILIAILWLIIGVWICWKRDWYIRMDSHVAFCIFAVILAPISLLLAIINQVILAKWEDYINL